MALAADTLAKKPRSFDPPQEPEWHRMIAEAAYFLAEKRGFVGEHSLDDWLAAEQQVRKPFHLNPICRKPHAPRRLRACRRTAALHSSLYCI
jgi:hypothetical protein